MKYILYWEMCPEDIDKVRPLFQKMIKLREKKGLPYRDFSNIHLRRTNKRIHII